MDPVFLCHVLLTPNSTYPPNIIFPHKEHRRWLFTYICTINIKGIESKLPRKKKWL